tara:strand:- start:1549 stop:2607 length:1059 start_codon:yes stop_codon:yes gene_type:complete
MTWGMAAVAGATLVGSAISANAAGKAAGAQASAARESGELAYQTSMQQIAAQKEALDKQIASQGAIVDKQLLAQRDALDQQLAVQNRMYEQSRTDFAPYRGSGVANVNQLNTLLGIGGDTGAADYGRFRTAEFTPEMFNAGMDPGYGFRMSEGLKAVDRQAAARGGLISGNALKASQAFGQDMASQEYNNAFNRYQTMRGNTLSPFQTGAAAGQSAAAMQGQANANYGSASGQAISNYGQGVSGAYGAQGQGANTAYGNYGQGVSGAYGAYGTNATNALQGGANATAAGYVGQANAVNQGISGISNAYYQNKMLDMFNPNSVSNLSRTYGANNVYGSGAANYQPPMPKYLEQ